MPHHYVIVGSGIAGLCAAESLREHDPKAVISMVSEEPHNFYSRPGLAYFLRNDFPEKQLTIRTADDVRDEAESTIGMDRMRHEGITIHTATQVKQAIGIKGKLTGVETQAGEIIPCQMLAIAIGVRPRGDLARQAGLAMNKGITVNEY